MVLKDMGEIVVDGGLNPYNNNMLTEKNSVFATCCVSLKETSDSHACTICRHKIHIFLDHASKCEGKDILCTVRFKAKKSYRK